LPCWQTSCH